MKTAIYIRVSTEDQAKEGFSINAQKEKLTSYANINDWEIVDYYIDDGISGKNIKDRPEVTRLIEHVKSGLIKNILVYKLDRLTRSLLNLMQLINLFEVYDCALNSHTEKLDTSNAVGRMFVKILGTFAEFERENLAERVSFGYEQKTKEGNYTNTNGVYGYDYIVGVGKLKVNHLESQVVNQIYDYYISGLSMFAIAKKLNENKIATKRNGSWSQSTIKSILTNPLYIGKIRYGVNKKIKYKSFQVNGIDIDKIVDLDKYNQVCDLIKKRVSSNTRKYSSINTYYFKALRCGICGGKMHARQQRHNGKLYVTYACNKQDKVCSSKGFSHNKLEESFIKYLDNVDDLETSSFVLNVNNNEEYDNTLKELSKIDGKKNETRNLFLEGKLPFDEYQILLEKMEVKKNQLNDLLLKVKPKEGLYKIEDIRNFIGNLKLNWKFLTNEEKKNFLDRFVDKIVVEKQDESVLIKDLVFYS